MTAAGEASPRSPSATADAAARGKPGELLSDQEIRVRYQFRPAAGELIIAVRRPITDRYGWNGTFQRFAEDLKHRFPGRYDSSVKTRDVAKRYATAFSNDCGPSLSIIDDVLDSCVPDQERAERKRAFRSLYDQARKQKGKVRSATAAVSTGRKPNAAAATVTKTMLLRQLQRTRSELDETRQELAEERETSRDLRGRIRAANARSVRLARARRWQRARHLAAFDARGGEVVLQSRRSATGNLLVRRPAPAGAVLVSRGPGSGQGRWLTRRIPNSRPPVDAMDDDLLGEVAGTDEPVPDLARIGLPPRWVALTILLVLTVLAVIVAFARLF